MSEYPPPPLPRSTVLFLSLALLCCLFYNGGNPLASLAVLRTTLLHARQLLRIIDGSLVHASYLHVGSLGTILLETAEQDDNNTCNNSGDQPDLTSQVCFPKCLEEVAHTS